MKNTLAYTLALGLTVAGCATNNSPRLPAKTSLQSTAFYNPHSAKSVGSEKDSRTSFIDTPYFVRRDNTGNVVERYFVERDHWNGTNDLGIILRVASETSVSTDSKDGTARLGDILYRPVAMKQGTNAVTGLKWSATGPNGLKVVRKYSDSAENGTHGSGVRVEFNRPLVKYNIDADGPEGALPARTWLAPNSQFGKDLPFAFAEDQNRIYFADGSFGVKPGVVYGWQKLTDKEADEISQKISQMQKAEEEKARKAEQRKKKRAERKNTPTVGDDTNPFLD